MASPMPTITRNAQKVTKTGGRSSGAKASSPFRGVVASTPFTQDPSPGTPISISLRSAFGSGKPKRIVGCEARVVHQPSMAAIFAG